MRSKVSKNFLGIIASGDFGDLNLLEIPPTLKISLSRAYGFSSGHRGERVLNSYNISPLPLSLVFIPVTVPWLNIFSSHKKIPNPSSFSS